MAQLIKQLIATISTFPTSADKSLCLPLAIIGKLVHYKAGFNSFAHAVVHVCVTVKNECTKANYFETFSYLEITDTGRKQFVFY